MIELRTYLYDEFNDPDGGDTWDDSLDIHSVCMETHPDLHKLISAIIADAEEEGWGISDIVITENSPTNIIGNVYFTKDGKYIVKPINNIGTFKSIW